MEDFNDAVFLVSDYVKLERKEIRDIHIDLQNISKRIISLHQLIETMIEKQTRLEKRLILIEKEIFRIPEEGEEKRAINLALRQYAMGKTIPVPFMPSHTYNPIGGI